MKKKIFLPILLFTTFIHCKKENGDDSPVELTKGLLAVFKFDTNMADSTGNVTIVGFTAADLDNVDDRKGNIGLAKIFTGGYWFAGLDPKWQANPFTVSFWINRADNVSNKYILSSNTGAIAIAQNGTKPGMECWMNFVFTAGC